MELPSELRNLFMVLTGSEWPTADETRLWELAQVYGTTADRLEVDLPQMVIRIKNRVRENFDATAADFFDESVDQFTAGERNYLGEGTAVARELQEYVHNAGTQVQYAKWTIIGQLVQLAAEIAWAIAMAPYTFGASMSQIPIFQAIARTVIGRVMFRLLSQLLQQMMISQFFALTMDALIQRIQIDNGVRDEWDQDLTEQAAQGATLDALFGTAAAFGGKALSDRFNSLLGNNTGPAIAHRLDGEFPPGHGPGAGDGLPEKIGSVMGRNNDELLRPYGMDNTPGWSRPVDGERFRTDMGEGFADSFGATMGRDQAREFGERYADAFARNWGRSGLDDALDNVVATHGRDLDPRMRDFLTTGVPNGVRDGLSDVGTHWKNFLAQLGGQGIANAGQGMLSEGFYNLLFSDEKSFSITWLSGVSGLVSGALQQSLTQGGLLLVEHLERAGLPDGVPQSPEPPMGSASDGGTTPGGGGGSPEASGGPQGEVSAADRSPSGRGEDEDGATPDPSPASPERVTTESSGTEGPNTAPTGSSTGAGRGGDPDSDTAPAPNDHGPYRPAAPPAQDSASDEDAATGPDPVEDGDRNPGSGAPADGVHLPADPGQEESEQEEQVHEAPVPAPGNEAEPNEAEPEDTGVRSPEDRPSSPAADQKHEDGPSHPVQGEVHAAGEDGPTAAGGDGHADVDGARPSVPSPGPDGGAEGTDEGAVPASSTGGAARDTGPETPAGRSSEPAGPPPPVPGDAGGGPDRPGGADSSTTRSPQGEDTLGGSGGGRPGMPDRSGDETDGTVPNPMGGAAPVPGTTPHPSATQGQESAGDGRRPAVHRPRPDPDAPAPVSPGLRPPENWQDTRDGAETARVGTHPDRSGVDTDGVEILDGSTRERPITSVAERGFDVRRVPLSDPEPGGPDHVTELTVRIRFDAGEGVRPEEAEAARRTFLDRAEEVLNQRYRLPGSGDQFHVRVEPVGPDGRPHSAATWSRDNPDLPGRSDTAHWRLDDGADVWLHEFLHRIGLDDEYRDPPREEGGRPPAVLRMSPDSTAVHEVGGYMDAPGGRGGRPPQVLNHYLEQIEAQVRGASRYDPPARSADLPESSRRHLASLLDPEGTRDGADTMALFGAVYDRHVRGRDDDRVRADLPARLRDEFDRTVTDWTGDGRWERALDAARGAGMEGPLSQMPAPAVPVTTQGYGDHRAAAPFSRFFESGGNKGRGEESHQLQERPRHGRNRGERSGTGEGPSNRPRSRVRPDRDASNPVGTEEGGTARNPVGAEDGTTRPGRLPDGNRVDDETERLLTEFSRPGFTPEEGGYPGVRRNGADVDGLRQRLIDLMHREGVEPVGDGFGEQVARLVDRSTDSQLEIPVRDRSDSTGAEQGATTRPERGRLRVSAEQVWYDTTGSPGARSRPAHAAESRAKAVGSGSQQSRKAVNIAAPLTVIGEIGGHVSLLSPRGKFMYSYRQRGTDYQTSRERRHKRTIDVDGDSPARFTGHLGIRATLDLDPPRTAGPAGNGPRSQQPREAGDRADRPAQGEGAEGRRTVEHSDALNGVFDVVLPGRLRTSDQASAPGSFRTDHDGVPVRAARFSRALKVLPGPGPDRFRKRLPNVPLDMSKLHENLGRMDLGEVLRLPYKDAKGRWQYAEISGGPVSYNRIGPEMSGSSFSDTDKTSSTAQTSASRSNKLDGRIGLGARIGSEGLMVVRAGPNFGGGGKYAGKSTRSTEHGSERVRGPGAKGDSAYYTVERSYRVTTTEDRPVPERPRDGAQGNQGNGGRTGPYTLSLTTLDQVLTSEASQLARAETGTGEDNGGDGDRGGRAGAGEARSGTRGDQDALTQQGPSTGRRHLGDSVPVQAEWSDGRLRDAQHRAPFTAVADRIHREVFAAHPELVNDPGSASDPHRGFFGQVWRGPDLRAANTMAIYEQVERAVAESDTLLSDGLPVVLRTGGMGNALTPAGRDDRDGAGFLTVRVTGSLEGGRPDGSRSDGSLSSGLNAWTSQGSGKQVTRSGGADFSGGPQLRFGETDSGLPAGIFEAGISGTYERESVRPASYTRKSGVQAASTAKGDVDSWIYGLRLQASIGTGAPVDITPTSAEGNQSRIRLRVEGPRTSPLPGEPGPDRTAGTPLGNAVKTLEQVRRYVEEARTQLVNDEWLVGELPDRVKKLRAAEEEATTTLETARKAEQASTEAARGAEEAERAASAADTRHREEVRVETRARADAALARQEAAIRLGQAAEAKLNHADALRGASGPPQGQDGGDGRPQQPTRPAPPEFVEAGTEGLGQDPGREAVDSARTAAERNWEVADAAMRSASNYADRISAMVAQTPRDTPPDTTATEQAWARADEAVKETRARAEEADAQEKAANRSREEAAERAGKARKEAVASAERSREASDELAGARTVAVVAVVQLRRAQRDHRASGSARDRLDTVRREFRARQQEELAAHPRAAEDNGRLRAWEFAEQRDARMRGRTDLDLDALPHAPGNTDARRLGEAIEDAVREAPGYESSSRSGEAVAQYRRHFGSPKALAAHSSDLHNGGLPLQSQFEDGTFQRANISLDLRADRTSMHVSDALPDSGIQLTYKTESTRASGAGGGSAVNTNIGFKGEGTPNPSDSRHNRLGGQIGVVPYATKGARSAGGSLTFTEEDAVTLPGTTVKVTATEKLTLESSIRNRFNLGASLPYGSTDSARRVLGSPTGGYSEQVTSETRYRALDLAQNGSLAGPHGLDTALTDARSSPPRIEFVPGNEGTGYALDGIDTKKTVQDVVSAVRREGFELTEQSKHDVRVALSPTNTRGTNRRLQNGGLVLSVNTLASGSERGFSTAGWMRLQLSGDSDGTPGFGSVESGFSSARTDSESPEQNSSEGKERKHGLTAGVGGGFNPVEATGTDSDGAPVFPSDRYWAVPLSAGTGWESATTKTETTSDTATENTTRTITAPGINVTRPMKVRFTLSLDNRDKTVLTGDVHAGTRQEIAQTGSFRFRPEQGGTPEPPSTPVPAGERRGDLAADPDAFARAWRGRGERSALPEAMVEDVGHGPISHAMLTAQARALGWEPSPADRSDAEAAVDHLRKKKPGARAPVLGAAADGQVLREQFGKASRGESGAVLIGEDGQGPFAVPGLETRMYTRPVPSRATIIGAGEMETERDHQHLHREERSDAQAGSTALNTGTDVSGMKGVDTPPASDFQEDSVIVGGGPSTAGANSTAAGGGKQSSSSMRTEAGPMPEKGRGYLVRVPVRALLVARAGSGKRTAAAEEVGSTVDLWLSREQITGLGARVSDRTFELWDTVADSQTAAADTEKKLGSALDGELGLNRDENSRINTRAALDLLTFPGRDPDVWSPETSDAVGALRDYFGPGPRDGMGRQTAGWGDDRAAGDRAAHEHRNRAEAAGRALEALRRGQGTRGGLTEDRIDALERLYRRRDALHGALSEHRQALDRYFDALKNASAPAVRTTTGTTDRAHAADRSGTPARAGSSANRQEQMDEIYSKALGTA
ncbi:WXG100-like domain-containing protein [Nocardiopsis kunsanensis]|uniref:WXG100-like domain-containing protein n=1 Tax=Nocardiopsis kunsanensis TaxID=141693 RepID=UPI00037168AC|nr:hypothetical protein [Nocardiopsis kunsanensis]